MKPPPVCPWLPVVPPEAVMDYRHLRRFGPERGAAFYLACLQYAQVLWKRGLTARALLCLDRAMGADLNPGDPILSEHPIPYRAMEWMILQNPDDVFMGNPRIHFQHYADRLGPPREEVRRWRAWACWHLTRKVRPSLPGDPRHVVSIPDVDAVEAGLTETGLPREESLWLSVLHGDPSSPS